MRTDLQVSHPVLDFSLLIRLVILKTINHIENRLVIDAYSMITLKFNEAG